LLLKDSQDLGNKIHKSCFGNARQGLKAQKMKKFKLLPWIPLEKLDWNNLSLNPNAIELLKEHPENIRWDYLAGCTNDIDFLIENCKNHNIWYWLSENPNDKAIELLRKNLKRIDWYCLAENPNDKAIELLLENPDKIYWYWFSSNTNDKAVELLKKFPNKISWFRLSKNSNGIQLLLENPDKIDWHSLSRNTNPQAIELLKANPKKIDWCGLSRNPSAIDLLKANPEKISWYYLSTNPKAIDLLKANPEKISWENLSANSGIFINLESTAITIQRAFRKSKKYIQWYYHPDRLFKQGYFNEI
jgi:hypothetical protein